MSRAAWVMCTYAVRSRMFSVGECADLSDESRELWCAWCKQHAAGQA